MEVFSNIVEQQTLRKVNLDTLKIIRDAVATSFGPYGSSSQIKIGDDTLPKFTKDGYTILMNLKFNGIIETSLKEVMEDLTRHVVKEVGDGTTSATLLSYAIFKRFVTMEEPNNPEVNYEIFKSMPPVEIEKAFKKVVKRLNEIITQHKRTIENAKDIKKIAMVSTNSDEELSQIIADIYKENGNEVYIDVKRSNIDEDYTKTYDGMTLNTGYGDKAYINDKELGAANINNPHIYFFEDPIDTPEMVGFLQKITWNNILEPLQNKKEFIPTVIVCPKISTDVNTILDNIQKLIFQYRGAGINIPFLMISNVHQKGIFMDIARLCNAKTIKKYIDFNNQKRDQENGDAPTMDTVHEFYGTADAVVSDYDKTKFINPQGLYKPGTLDFSDEYLQMVEYLKTEVESAKRDGQSLNTIGDLKRRYNALKANMVDLFIGGATPEERDNRFDAAEDAVLNCRSAAANGYGYGANVEGFSAVSILRESSNFANDKLVMAILDVLYNSYLDIMAMLYGSAENLYLDSYKEYEEAGSKAVDYVNKVIKNWVPVDVVTKRMSYDIMSSIDSDTSILEIIAKLMTILINCKQFVCPLPTVSYKQSVELDNGVKAILE